MIKALQLLTVLLFLISNVSAQQVDVKWGPSLEIPKKTFVSQILGEYQGKTFLLREKSGSFFSDTEYSIDEYSSADYNLLRSISWKIPALNGKAGELEAMYFLKGKLFSFVSYFDKDSGRNSAYLKVDEILTGVEGQLKSVDEIIAPKKKNKGEFDFVLSQDSSKILVYHVDPFEKAGTEKFTYKLLNVGSDEQWSKRVELPYKDREFRVSDFIVDKNENIFMLARLTNERERWIKGRPNYKYNILALFKNDGQIKEYDVSLPQRSISDIGFRLAANGDLIAAGFYSNIAKSEEDIGGTFFLRVDVNSKEVKATGIKDFEKEFLTQFMSERRANKGKELYNYIIDHVIADSTGGAIVVAEQYYENTICSTDPRTGATRCNYYYYYNDLIVVKVSPTGEIIWTRKIPKRQLSINDQGTYLSYVLIQDRNNFYFIFNDNPKNLGKKEGDRFDYMSNHKKSICAMVTLSNTGDMKKQPLFGAKDQSIVLRPSLSLSLKPSETLLFGQRRKEYKLGKLTIGN